MLVRTFTIAAVFDYSWNNYFCTRIAEFNEISSNTIDTIDERWEKVVDEPRELLSKVACVFYYYYI